MSEAAEKTAANPRHKWYIVHAYSNFEKKVAESIREQAKQRGLEDLVDDILVPTETVTEMRRGRKVNSERKFYPGYVLVEMLMKQDTMHTINGIQGVIKFVGHEKFPMPLRPDEVNRLLGIAEAEESAPKGEIPFLVGQAVAITEGPFTDFNGTVEEVMADKGKVRVSVSLFGRPTSVELDYLQLKSY